MSDDFREVTKKVDAISRQDAIDEICDIRCGKSRFECELYKKRIYISDCSDCDYIRSLLNLPPAQPEPAIPLQWIEEQIEWLKSLDNAFSTLTAGQISAMVNKWKGEQDG